jgi:hypothetical protein
MGVITQAVIVQAAIEVNGMSASQKVRLADEIFAQQPNLLASILVLPSMGVGMVELDVPLNILFVAIKAMCGRSSVSARASHPRTVAPPIE